MHNFKGREMDVGEAIEILVDVAKSETKRWGSNCKFGKDEMKQAICIMEDFVRISKARNKDSQ
tara:strand:- start:2381 stop:2569 length:189 start_codon:yes stop_codon:yes gene_type:complete